MMITIEEAQAAIESHLFRLPTIDVETLDAVGQRLASEVVADIDSPPHDKSVMDGYAVRARDFEDAECPDTFECVETVTAGEVPAQAIGPGQTTKIMTGAPVPKNANAVVMVEQTEADGSGRVRFLCEQVRDEQNVLRRGANFQKGQTLFRPGHRIRPTDTGLLSEVGMTRVSVVARPRVAVLPTGDELVPADQVPAAGKIRNSNGPMLTAMARHLGVAVTALPIGRDQPGQLKKLIEQGLDNDVFILTGGVSAGEKDLVPELLQAQGVQEVFHKVLVKPGKPIWFGVRKRDPGVLPTLVFGLPGNPVSSLVGFRLFVQPALEALAGGDFRNSGALTTELAKPHQTRGNRPTYWPGRWIEDDSAVRRVEAVRWNGSSDLLALGRADGLIRFPLETHDHREGEAVLFFPF